ncbi:MAG: SHOCT domain-containing protein [Propionibacteriaceae bacterium]
MGLLVLTSERILFRARRSTGPTSVCHWGTSLLSRHTPARCRHCPHHQEHLSLDAELRALRDSGMITDAEFEIRKSAIWRQI